MNLTELTRYEDPRRTVPEESYQPKHVPVSPEDLIYLAGGPPPEKQNSNKDDNAYNDSTEN